MGWVLAMISLAFATWAAVSWAVVQHAVRFLAAGSSSGEPSIGEFGPGDSSYMSIFA
jgi:hypothetical protein